MKHDNHKENYRSEHKHEEQQTMTREVITEFENLAYVSGPLSQWVRLSYLCSKDLKVHHNSSKKVTN